jgi:hypothetical protein
MNESNALEMQDFSDLSLWDLRGATDICPETPAELHQWIKSYCRTETGQKACVPVRRMCPGHDAPFEFVSDAFFQRYLNQLVLAPRTGGKTFDLGLLAFLEMYHRGRVHPLKVLNVGAVEDQARKCFRYSASLWRQPEFKYMVGRGVLKESIILPNETEISTTVATVNGVNGPHVPRLQLDELELWKWEIIQQAFSIPESSGPHRAAVRLASTRKYAYGNMQRFLDEAPQRGFKVYKWCIWETIQQCVDRDCSKCPVLNFPDAEGGELCGGRAKDARGFYSIDDFIAKAKSLDRRTLEEEWLCLRPSREGVVFGREYREEIHRVGDIPYQAELPLYVSIDQGFTNPFAVLFAQESLGRLRIIGELYRNEMIPEEMGHEAANYLERLGVEAGRKIPVVFDPEDPAAARTFVKHLTSTKGRQYYGTLKFTPGPNELEDRLRLIRRRLKLVRGVEPQLAISARVKMLPYELTQYHYPQPKAEDRPIAETPIDKDNHTISAWYRLEAYLKHPQSARGSTARIM